MSSETMQNEAATLLERVIARPNDSGSDFSSRQAQAAETFRRRGLPPADDEEWRYTNVAPIARAQFRPLADAAVEGESSLHIDGAIEIVIRNGRAVAAPDLPAGVSVLTGEAARRDVAVARVGTLVRSTEHRFAALNLALLDQLVVVRVSARTVLDAPLHVISEIAGGDEPVAQNLRVVVIAESGSQFTLVESFGGTGRYLANSVTELFVEESALVDHYKVECESDAAWHIGNMAVHLARHSSVRTSVISFGGALVRNELLVTLDGEGSEAMLRGLYVLRGEQRVDNHTVIVHAQPHTTSLEHYKGILDGRSFGAFDGKIVVARDAQKTSSKQTNNNLLLSRDAVADSKPQLEIHADDVKCAHGSTIGQLDEEAIFYLRSRGIDEAHARSVLSFAFASEIVGDVRIPALRKMLERQLLQRIPSAAKENA